MLQQPTNFPSELAGEARELRNLARFLVQSDEAEDLTQDTMVTALSQRKRPRALRPWLRQVLRNEHRAQARRARRRRAREGRIEAPAPPPAMDDDAAHAEVIVALREALAGLDEPYRDVLRQRFFEDRTASDIARSEGCPAGTVRWRVQEGLRRMRRKLDERFDGRTAWFGGAAAFAGIPLTPPEAATAAGGASTMTNATILKILLATAATAGGTTLILEATTNEPEPEVAEPVATHYEAAPQARPQEASALSLTQADREREAIIAADSAAAPSPAPTEDKECFAGLGIEPGEMVQVIVDLDRDEKILHAELDPERFGEAVDVTDCVTAKYGSIHMEGLDPDDAPHRVRIALNPIKAVDADAPDPTDLAEAFGLPPRGAQKDAKVKIVECAEFDCPFCTKARRTMDRVVADYGDDVAVYWLHAPLPVHKGAEPAARAATAAGNQGKFWEMADLLFDNPDRRTDDDFVALAKELGLDLEQFKADYGDEATAQAVQDQAKACRGNGARGTPAFFVNGDLMVGARPYEQFKEIIDDELKG